MVDAFVEARVQSLIKVVNEPYITKLGGGAMYFELANEVFYRVVALVGGG